MISFPNAKINLGLNVVEKRNDGYHNIETVLFPVGWCDILEIIPSEKQINRKSDIHFKSSGIKITGSAKKNLCLNAYHLLKEEFHLPPVEMHLHKNIPIGAGLGGGSSDAAHTIMLLNTIFDLRISDSRLMELALMLGSDCPFFIHNKPVYARGLGNEFESIDIDLSGYRVIILKPDAHVSTAQAYKKVKPKKPDLSLKEILKKEVKDWKDLLANDFEESIFKSEPAIRHLKDELYREGALYASMSGSGSAVFGIFNETTNLKNQFREYQNWTDSLALLQSISDGAAFSRAAIKRLA